MRACVREPGRGAGLRDRGGRASGACSGGGGRKGAVAVGEGRVAAARGELLGRSGLGDCVFPLLQWAAVKRLAQSARAGAPNFRLFLFWPEPRFLSLQAQPVALQYAPSPLRAVPRRRGGTGSALWLWRHSICHPLVGTERGEVEFILNFLTAFTQRVLSRGADKMNYLN